MKPLAGVRIVLVAGVVLGAAAAQQRSLVADSKAPTGKPGPTAVALSLIHISEPTRPY